MKIKSANENNNTTNKRVERIITCAICGQQKKHYAKGLCHNCYKAQAHRDKVGTIVKYCAMCGNRIYRTSNITDNEIYCSLCRQEASKNTNQDKKNKMLKKYRKLYKNYPEVVTDVTLHIWEDYLLGLQQTEVARRNHTTRQNVNDIIMRIKRKLNEKVKKDKDLHKTIKQKQDINKENLEKILLTATSQDLNFILQYLKSNQSTNNIKDSNDTDIQKVG